MTGCAQTSRPISWKSAISAALVARNMVSLLGSSHPAYVRTAVASGQARGLAVTITRAGSALAAVQDLGPGGRRPGRVKVPGPDNPPGTVRQQAPGAVIRPDPCGPG